jgi:hypothetical protein
MATLSLATLGQDGDGALAHLARLWRSVSAEKRDRYPCSPQTAEQIEFVRRWGLVDRQMA